MRYAKIVDGRVQFAPRKLENVPRTFPPEEEDGEPISGLYTVNVNWYTFDPAAPENADIVAYLSAEGYLPVVESQRPEDGDGYYYIAGYELGHDDTTDTDEIVQVWERREYPAPDPNPEISAERALGIILTGRDSYEAE